VVVYLRPQVDAAMSFYTTELQLGSVRTRILPDPAQDHMQRRYDYAALLGMWAAAMPAAVMRPRLFMKEDLYHGDVLQDFLQVAGIDLPDAVQVPARNASLSAAAQVFLRAANAAIQGGADLDRARIVRRLRTGATGPGRRPAKAAARAFMQAWAGSNEAVRAQYFPQRAQLFAVSCDGLHTAATPAALNAADYAQLMSLITGQAGRGLQGDLVSAVAAEPGLRTSAVSRLREWLRHRMTRVALRKGSSKSL
jgi:hypothetical protein